MQRIKSFLITNWIRIIAFTLVLVLMVCSMTVFASIFTDPQTYSKTIQSIDDKKLSVLGVSAAIAGSSTLLSSVPGDAANPLAEELMDLSSYLVIVICVLVLEKSLLTVFGSVSCYILFPIACCFVMAFIIRKKQVFLSWAIKLAVLALALLTIVPCAMKISDYIYEVNQVTIEQDVEMIVEPTENENEKESQSEEESPWYKKLWDTVTDAVDDAAEAVADAGKKAIETGKQALSKFTDAVSVFIIAYCAIPIFIVFLFLWLLKILFGIDISINNLNPMQFMENRREKRRRKKEEKTEITAL